MYKTERVTGPRQANLVLIAYASSEGSGKPAIRTVSPEPPLLALTSSESRVTSRQKARSLAPLNGWACAVKICHDGMLEDTNLLDGAQMFHKFQLFSTSFVPQEFSTEDIMFNISTKSKCGASSEFVSSSIPS